MARRKSTRDRGDVNPARKAIHMNRTIHRSHFRCGAQTAGLAMVAVCRR
jgi:hypothetical protein